MTTCAAAASPFGKSVGRAMLVGAMATATVAPPMGPSDEADAFVDDVGQSLEITQSP